MMVIILVHLQAPGGAYAIQRANSKSIEPTPIRLVLRTAHKKFRSGEPIEMLAYLENISDKPYYVGNDLGKFFIIESFHYIELQITDQRGREAPIGRGAATSIWEQGTTVNEKLAKGYVLLQPGMVFGQKDAGNITLQPGTYKLTAKYYEVEALQWGTSERESLPIPVWTRPLVSNTVTIIVTPRGPFANKY